MISGSFLNWLHFPEIRVGICQYHLTRYLDKNPDMIPYVFNSACQCDYPDMVDYILGLYQLQVDLAIGLETASFNGNLSIVTRLIPWNFDYDKSLQMACQNGHNLVVEQLLLAGANPAINNYLPFRLASVEGHHVVVDQLIRAGAATDLDSVIRMAGANGHVLVVDRLLQAGADPSAFNNELIRLASMSGHHSVVDRILQDSRVNPSNADNYAIREASKNGHILVVERLLQDSRVDPSDQYNHAIQEASKNGHLPVVERLLQDPRVDPSASANYAIREAIRNGHAMVAKQLLASGIKSSSDLIQIACRNKDLESVNVLLTDPNVDPNDGLNAILCLEYVPVIDQIVDRLLRADGVPNVSSMEFICLHGYLAAVDRLLQVGTDPGVYDNIGIRVASRYGHLAIVDRLLRAGANPEVYDNAPIRSASMAGHTQIVERLLLDARVDPSACKNYAIKHASRNGHRQIVDRLRSDPRFRES